MIVVIGGMPRSGSTFTFNIARESLLIRGHTARWVSVGSLSDALLGEAGDFNHLIIKTHAPDELMTKLILMGGAVCICSHRRPENAIKSWMNTFGHDFTTALTLIEDWIKWHQVVRHVSQNVSYETIESDLGEAIETVQRSLGFASPVSVDKLSEKYSKGAVYKKYAGMEKSDKTVDIGFSYYDPETFFHRSHVSDVASPRSNESLSKDNLEEMMIRLAPYISPAGEYIVQRK